MAEPTSQRFERDPAALWRGMSGGVLIMPSQSTEAWLITAPGQAIWDLLDEPRSSEEVADALALAYREPTRKIVADIEPILRMLEEIHAIRVV